MLDADQIVPNLWQGSRPPTGSVVADAGFDILVLCARDYQPIARHYPGVRVIHAPNDDMAWIRKDDLHVAAQTAGELAAALARGHKILVTCVAGINRSGLVVALTIHKAYGYSGKSCINFVRRRRKIEDDVALRNPVFVEALLKLVGQDQVVLRGYPRPLSQPSNLSDPISVDLTVARR